MPKAAKLSAKDIEKILATDEANIAKLVGSGRPLPKWLRQKLEDQKNGVAQPGVVWAASKEELRKILTISRPTMNRLFKIKGSPKAGSNGKHHVPTWRQFASAHVTRKIIPSGDPNTPPLTESLVSEEVTEKEKLALRKLRADAETAEIQQEDARFESELKRGRYLLKSDVRDAIIKANEKVKAELQRHFIQTTPAEYEQCLGEQKECRAINQRSLDEVFRFINKLEL